MRVRFEVRELGLHDLPRVLTLVHSCSDAPRWPEAVWRQAVSECELPTGIRRRLFAAVDDGADRLLGLLAATCLAESSEVESVLVAADARGQGVGLQLGLRWLHWAAAEGAKEALLEVRASNAAAVVLYERMGFTRQAVRKRYYSDPVEDAVLMRKLLTSAGA